MATLVFTDAKVFIAQYDVSGDLNQIQLNIGAEMVENTTFGAAARTKKPGLFTVDYSMQGYANFGTGNSEEGLYGKVGTTDIPHTLVPDVIAVGGPCYFFKGAQAEYSPSGGVGEMLKFSVNGGVSGGACIKGKILETGATARNASGNTAEVLLGACTIPQKLYAVVHVLAKSGTTPTLDIIVQSDTTGFGTPANQITFAQFNNTTGLNATYATPLSANIADTYYRINYTIGGGSPSFRFVAAVGIL